jgi:transmembrane sensor
VERLARAGARIDAGLSDGDLERLIESARQRGRRRAVLRVGLATAAAGAAVAVLLVGGVSRWPSAPVGQVSEGGMGGSARRGAAAGEAAASRALVLADGSRAVPLDGDSVLAVLEDTPYRVRLAVERGGGRFDVTSRTARSFSVVAGEVTVTVVGTVFEVRRMKAAAAITVDVRVERGTVEVDWRVGKQRLQGGESGWFPPSPPPPPSPVSSDAPPPVPPGRGQLRAGAGAGARGRAGVAAAAGVGDGGAAAAPDSPKTAPPPRTAEQLLSAADAARLAGRPDEGAALLKRLLDEHGADPRAPLAAFTLGRVLLMHLDRPREAAAAFADVRARAPAGSFAEDALAREVEAWTKAGEPERARERAEEYLRLYPGGSRTRTVKALGGIE